MNTQFLPVMRIFLQSPRLRSKMGHFSKRSCSYRVGIWIGTWIGDIFPNVLWNNCLMSDALETTKARLFKPKVYGSPSTSMVRDQSTIHDHLSPVCLATVQTWTNISGTNSVPSDHHTSRRFIESRLRLCSVYLSQPRNILADHWIVNQHRLIDAGIG